MAIRYDKSFNKQIRRIVNNFNRKVQRAESKGIKNTPSTIKVSELKLNYKNRYELKRRLNQLNKFNLKEAQKTVRVGTDNLKMNRWQYDTYKSNQKYTVNKINQYIQRQEDIDRLNKRILPSERTRQLKSNLKALQKAAKPGATASQIKRASAIAKRYNENRAESDEIFRDNFFDMLWANSSFYELDENTVQRIQDELSQLEPDQLLELYNNEPYIKTIVEGYHTAKMTSGQSISQSESDRFQAMMEQLEDNLPYLIDKYSKI